MRLAARKNPGRKSGLLERFLDFLALRHRPGESFFWKLNLTFWTLYAAGMFTVRLFVGRDPWQALAVTAACEGFTLLLSLFLRWYYRRLSLRFGVPSAIRVTLVSLLAAACISVFTTAAVYVAGWHPPLRTFSETGMLRLSYTWMVLLAWSYGYLWVRTELALRAESRFARRARREAYRMELNLLRSQLDPHFLFNSLNGISAEIRPHPEAAVNMVNELADYLRYSLDHRKQALATLGEEVAAMTAYLKIEHARFGDALRFEVELAPAAAACRVPSFLLQPLVENAVKHGFDPEKGPMLLRINAQICGLFLTIEVANNGQLGSAQARSGVGLDNLRRRLDLHYPRRHSFSLSEIGGEVIARLELEGPPCSA